MRSPSTISICVIYLIKLGNTGSVADHLTAASLRTHYTNATSPAATTTDEGYHFSFVFPPPSDGYHVATTCTPTYLGDEAPMLFTGGETCFVQAASVDLFYWPTPYSTPGVTATITAAPSQVTKIGPDGYTYTSPSVYVIYHGLEGVPANLGTSYSILTVAYGPTELSTLYGCSQTELSTKALNYEDFNMPPRWSVLSEHQACDTCGQVYQFPGPPHPDDELVSNYANMTYAYNAMVNGVASWRLQPAFVLPPALTDANPGWKGCNGFTWGVFDPPHTLEAQSAMVDPTPSPSAPPAGDPAKPASLPADPSTIPAQTPAPSTNQQSLPSDTKPSTPVNTPLDSPQAPASGSSKDPAADPPQGSSAANSPLDPSSDPSQGSPAGLPNDPASNPLQNSAVNSPQGQPPSLTSVAPLAAQVTVAGHTVAAHPSGGIAVDGNHIQSVNSAIIPISGVQISQNSDGIVIGDNTIQVPSEATIGAFTALNGQGIEKASGGGVVIGGSTLSSGAMTSIGGIQVSVGEGIINVLPTTLPYVPITPSSPQSANRPVISSSPAGTNPGNTFAPGGQTGGQTGGQAGGQQSPAQNAPALGIIAAGQTWTPLNKDTVIANSVTVSSGGPVITAGGMILSMGASGLIAGSSTIAVPNSGAQAPATTGGSASMVFAAAGKTFTALGNDQLMVDGAVVSDGAPATAIGGISISLGSSVLVVGLSTIPISSTIALSPIPTPFTAAGHTFTPLGNSEVAADGTTLTVGGAAMTSNSTAISLGSGGLVIGASTTIPVPASTPTSEGLGAVIMSGFGPSPAASSTGPEAFEGAAVRMGRVGLIWWKVVGILFLFTRVCRL